MNALRRYDPDETQALIRRPTDYIAAFTEAVQEVSRIHLVPFTKRWFGEVGNGSARIVLGVCVCVFFLWKQ